MVRKHTENEFGNVIKKERDAKLQVKLHSTKNTNPVSACMSSESARKSCSLYQHYRLKKEKNGWKVT